MTNPRYTQPQPVRIRLRSASRNRFGVSTPKWRFSRSPGVSLSPNGVVVTGSLPRRVPTSSILDIKGSTVQSVTTTPATRLRWSAHLHNAIGVVVAFINLRDQQCELRVAQSTRQRCPLGERVIPARGDLSPCSVSTAQNRLEVKPVPASVDERH